MPAEKRSYMFSSHKIAFKFIISQSNKKVWTYPNRDASPSMQTLTYLSNIFEERGEAYANANARVSLKSKCALWPFLVMT